MLVAMKTVWLPLLLVLLGSCAPSAGVSSSASNLGPGVFAKDTPEWRGQKFARNRCSDCHGVELSNNPATSSGPTFKAIVNRPGTTPLNLKAWLNSVPAHPRQMYFEIPAEHVDDLVAYMFTLRDETEPPGD